MADNRAEKIAKAIKTGGVVISVFYLIKIIFVNIIIIAVMLFLITLGFPWHIGVAVMVFSIALTIFQIIRIRRIATAKLIPPVPQPPSQSVPLPLKADVIKAEPDKKITDYIAGIIAVGFTVRGFAWLGKGEMAFPQNALIITNKRIAFITVPVIGASKIVADTQIGMWQWLLAKKDIENKLKEMLTSQSLEKVLQCHPKNFSIRFEEIKKIKMSSFQQKITFITKDNKKYSYSTRDKNDFKKAKMIFHDFL